MLRLLTILILIASAAGCHSVSGNVIPESGPTMETVYDSMGVHSQNVTTSNAEVDLSTIRQGKTSQYAQDSAVKPQIKSEGLNHFHQLPNPILKLYVYPHFASNDEVPIPGYYTEFNAYERTHYFLPSEVAN